MIRIVASLVFTGSVSAQTVEGYHIGNSLTWDSQPLQQKNFAVNQGFTLDNGYHIYCANPLINIINNPQNTCLDPVSEWGYFSNALTRDNVGYVTVQPYLSAVSTQQTDLYSIQYFDSLLVNPDATIFLYAAWGSMSLMESGDWYLPSPNLGSTLTVFRQEYFDDLYNLLDYFIDREVNLIPVGEVLNELVNRGVVTWPELYRDQIHMSYDLGRYVAATTAFSVIHNTNPVGLHESWHNYNPANKSLYVSIDNVIWDVISNDARTGVTCLADVNRDNLLTPADFNAWTEAYNVGNTMADQNQDGFINPNDFNSWILNYNLGC